MAVARNPVRPYHPSFIMEGVSHPAQTMRFRESLPPEDLSKLVACFWEFVAGPDVPAGHIHTIPVDGCTSVSCLVGQGPVGVIGPRLESYRIPIYPNTTYMGVRFVPGATYATIGLEGAKLRDHVGLLDVLAPGLATEFRAALRPGSTLDQSAVELASVVRGWSAGRTPPDEIVQAAVAAMTMSAGTARVTTITEKIGLSERQFLRRFRSAVGLTPKQFGRVVRFRAAAVDVAMRDAKSWGEVAAERGYSDQSHLVREFAEIFGMTPTEFKRVFAPGIEHVDVR